MICVRSPEDIRGTKIARWECPMKRKESVKVKKESGEQKSREKAN